VALEVPQPRWATESPIDTRQSQGLIHIELASVQDPFWLLGDLESRMVDPAQHDALLESIDRTARGPALLGASSRVLGEAKQEARTAAPILRQNGERSHPGRATAICEAARVVDVVRVG